MNEEKHLELVDRLIESTVAEHAAAVDQNGAFPSDAIEAFLASPLAGLLVSESLGGLGAGPRQAMEVVERIARHCGSSAMVVTMHYAGSAVIEEHGDEATRRAIAAGEHLSTLAFSERGSRSHFWAPVGTATKKGNGVALRAEKSFVTSANHATAYVWSSRPVNAEGASTLWLVPRDTKGITAGPAFDGLGLRGNDSAAVRAEDAVVSEAQRLGDDGRGFDIMLGTVLPLFNVLTAAVAVGFMDAATTASAGHAAAGRFEHLDAPIAELPTIRAYLARMRCKTDMARALLLDTVSALESMRADATLRVLESKACAGESATEVLDLAMRVCGGAAFRRDVGVERIFRDARAGTVMAPTTDQLYDFIGKAICGMDVF